jgi:cell division protein FtsB
MDMDIASTLAPYVTEAVPVGGALFTAAFWKLWKRVETDHQETKAELDKCEKDHIATKEEMASLKEDLGFLRGRQDGIEDLARNVLEVVARGATQKND